MPGATPLPPFCERARSTEVFAATCEPTDAAALLIAMVEGYGSLAKNAQDPKVIKAGIKNIVAWLKSLRRPGNRKRI